MSIFSANFHFFVNYSFNNHSITSLKCTLDNTTKERGGQSIRLFSCCHPAVIKHVRQQNWRKSFFSHNRFDLTISQNTSSAGKDKEKVQISLMSIYQTHHRSEWSWWVCTSCSRVSYICLKAPKGCFYSDVIEESFWFPTEPFSEQFLNEPLNLLKI